MGSLVAVSKVIPKPHLFQKQGGGTTSADLLHLITVTCTAHLMEVLREVRNPQQTMACFQLPLSALWALLRCRLGCYLY